MKIKEFFIEPLDNSKVSDEKMTKTVEETGEDYIMLRDLDMIHNTTFVMGKIYPDEILVTRNALAGDTKSVKIKNPGFHGRMPLFKEAYIVDTNDFFIEINDTKSPDGKYSQSIGIGEDIKITLRLTIAATEEEKYLANLIKQKRSYKAAIRKASERIMRLLINERLLVHNLDQEDILAVLNKVTSEGIKLNFEKDDMEVSENYDEILDIATSLLEDYGLIIKEVSFADIDLPEALKKITNERIGQQDKIKMKRRDAENGVYVAEKEKEAELQKLEAKVELITKMKEAGISESEIAKILTTMEAGDKAMVFVQNGNSSGITENLMMGNIAAQRAQESKGKSK